MEIVSIVDEATHDRQQGAVVDCLFQALQRRQPPYRPILSALTDDARVQDEHIRRSGRGDGLITCGLQTLCQPSRVGLVHLTAYVPEVIPSFSQATIPIIITR